MYLHKDKEVFRDIIWQAADCVPYEEVIKQMRILANGSLFADTGQSEEKSISKKSGKLQKNRGR